MADKKIIIGRVINVTGMVGVSAGIVLFAEASRGSATFRDVSLRLIALVTIEGIAVNSRVASARTAEIDPSLTSVTGLANLRDRSVCPA
jgi:hypothetical protein